MDTDSKKVIGFVFSNSIIATEDSEDTETKRYKEMFNRKS
jgi:hypothetical protein